MTFDELYTKLSDLAEEILDDCTPHSPEAAGLDRRCGTVYLGEGFIASRYAPSLDYYGGFEYIDKEHILALPEIKVYSIESDRVADCVASIEHNCD